MLKKWLIILSVCFLFTGLTIPRHQAEAATAISKNHWAYSSITQLQSQKILDASASTKYNKKVTRAEAAVVFAKILPVNVDASKVKLVATDINEKLPYYNSIKRLVAYGVIVNDKKFRPNDYLTRAEIAKMVMYTLKIQEDLKTKKSFSDVKRNHWAYVPVLTLADCGIINGYKDYTFKPSNKITFAELASMIQTALTFTEKQKNLEVIYDGLNRDYIETINQFPLFEEEIIKEVNAFRQKNGLSTLNRDPHLTQLAIIKSKDMVEKNYFSHNSPTYSMSWELAGTFNYEFVTMGENLAKNYTKAKDVVNAWVASKDHLANLMSTNYSYIGVGIRKDSKGNYYISNLFSGK